MTKERSAEERAFREAIKATPEDDLPRLVYADWLDKNDQPGKATRLRLAVERRQLRRQAWTERVIPTAAFDTDFDAVETPLCRIPLGVVFKVCEFQGVDEHIKGVVRAESCYLQACHAACFGRPGMEQIGNSHLFSLWENGQKKSLPQTVGQFLQDRRKELIEAYLESQLVTGRPQAIDFANEIAATAQAMAKEVIANRGRHR